MRGFNEALQFHKENTGLAYALVRLKKSGDSAEVRVLQPEDEWVSLFIHQEFQKLKQTRCASDGQKDANACPLCALDAKRRLRTFIPVRLRGDTEEDRVQFVEAGRNTLTEIVSQIEELPEGTSITSYDWKIKRIGEDFDTEYKWHVKSDTKRPLDDREKALVIPNIEELIELPDDVTMQQRAKSYRQTESTPVDEKPAEPKKGTSRF